MNSRFIGYANDHFNDYFNNTANYNAISAGANDLALDPQYVAAGSNWAIGTNLKAKGFPAQFRNSSTNTYVDIGAAQRQEAGGGMLSRRGFDGGFP